jgi:hypothetical protein
MELRSSTPVFDGRNHRATAMTTAADETGSRGSLVVPPVVLDAHGELLFFRTCAHLQAYVEATDVASGRYGCCWDAEGRLLRLSIGSTHSSLLGVLPYRQDAVRVEVTEEQPTHLTDLHLALLRHVEAVNLGAEMPVTNDTTDLLEFAIEHAGWS